MRSQMLLSTPRLLPTKVNSHWQHLTLRTSLWICGPGNQIEGHLGGSGLCRQDAEIGLLTSLLSLEEATAFDCNSPHGDWLRRHMSNRTPVLTHNRSHLSASVPWPGWMRLVLLPGDLPTGLAGPCQDQLGSNQKRNSLASEKHMTAGT